MPTVSINATAVPSRALAPGAAAGQHGLAQRDFDQPSGFASFLDAQTDNPPVGTIEHGPSAPPSLQGDSPSRQVTNLPLPANDGHDKEAGALPGSGPGSGKDALGAATFAGELGLPSTKIARKATTSADGSAWLAATAPTPVQSPTQNAPVPNTSAANVEPTDISAGAAATLVARAGAAGDTAAPALDDTDTDKDGKAAKNEPSGETLIAGAPDSSPQNSQLGSDAATSTAAVITPQPVAAVAAAIPMPVALDGSQRNRDGADTDPLTVSEKRSPGIDLPLLGVTSPKPALTPAVSPDPTGTPTAVDASHQTPTPISNGDQPHKACAALPTDSAAPIATATTTAAASTAASPPAAPISQPDATTPPDAGAIGSGEFAKASIESGDRTRDIVKLPDSSGNGGLALQTQPLINPPGAAGATHSTAASAPSPTTAAPVPVAEVGVTIAMQAQLGKSRFEIRLDPPELGRIDVELNVDSRGTVTSRLVVERPETLNLLVRDAPQLQRALQDAGLNTAGGMQFSLADQGSANRNGFAEQNEFASPPASRDIDGDAMPVAPLQSYTVWARRNGGLDITV